jgi:hypothetical protein
VQLPPALRHARDSTGKPVVVKLLRSGSEELSILKYFRSVESSHNHTIKLLNSFSVDRTTFVVLPQAERLDIGFMSASLRELAEELSTQFFQGVAFLHHNGIAPSSHRMSWLGIIDDYVSLISISLFGS